MNTFGTGGKKDLTGKLPLHLVTKKMLEGIATAMDVGLKKGYEKNNWQKGLPICEAHLGAAIRHIGSYMEGHDTNTETATDGSTITTHHLDHALCHLAMAVHQVKSGRTDLDDRATTQADDKQKQMVTQEDLDMYLQREEGVVPFIVSKGNKPSHSWGDDVFRLNSDRFPGNLKVHGLNEAQLNRKYIMRKDDELETNSNRCPLYSEPLNPIHESRPYLKDPHTGEIIYVDGIDMDGSWFPADARAMVKQGIKEAKEGKGKPLSFNLEDDLDMVGE